MNTRREKEKEERGVELRINKGGREDELNRDDEGAYST